MPPTIPVRLYFGDIFDLGGHFWGIFRLSRFDRAGPTFSIIIARLTPMDEGVRDFNSPFSALFPHFRGLRRHFWHFMGFNRKSRFSSIFRLFNRFSAAGRETEWESWESAENRAGIVGIHFSLDLHGWISYNICMEIISRKEAQERGLERYFTGVPCKRGHTSERYATGDCVACNLYRTRKWRKSNPEHRKEYKREYCKANPEQKKEHDRKYYAANKDKINEKRRKEYEANTDGRREYREANKDKIKERRRKYYEANRGKIAEQQRKLREANPERYLKYREANLEKIREKNRKYYEANKDKMEEQNRKWREANSEKIKARQQKYREDNRDIIRERHRKWCEANSEKVREGRQRWEQANPEKVREGRRRWVQANPEKMKKKRREYLQSPVGQLHSNCAQTARALDLGRLNHSRLEWLDYDADEKRAHLENTLPPLMTYEEARQMGYHIDHIVPKAFISAVFSLDAAGRKKAFQVVEDLKNLQMIPGLENMQKRDRLDLDPEQAAVFEYLCDKYDAWDEMVNQAIPY